MDEVFTLLQTSNSTKGADGVPVTLTLSNISTAKNNIKYASRSNRVTSQVMQNKTRMPHSPVNTKRRTKARLNQAVIEHSDITILNNKERTF